MVTTDLVFKTGCYIEKKRCKCSETAYLCIGNNCKVVSVTFQKYDTTEKKCIRTGFMVCSLSYTVSKCFTLRVID